MKSPPAVILVAPSVTKLGSRHRGAVLVAGSHGGRYAALLAARAGIRAVILSDAGGGFEQAGTAGIAALDDWGIPGAAVDVWSARIGDGADMLARGRISVVNAAAAALGCEAGMAVAACAELMRAAPLPERLPPPGSEDRWLLCPPGPRPAVWALDSASLVAPGDAGAVLMLGSHGGTPGGDPARALMVDALAAVFNDAGIGIERAGLSRLPMLDRRGIAAATVAAATARIGEGRSTWQTGVISAVNETAAAWGARIGQTAPELAATIMAKGERQ